MSDLQTLLSSGYDRESWLARLQQFFPGIEIFSQPQAVEDNRVASFDYLGKAPTADGQQLGIYEIKVGANTQLARNRVQLRQMVAKQVLNQALGGALAVYYDHGQQWRFSFISMEYKLNKQGQIDKQESTPKRYTYLLGKGANIRTAVERFSHLPRQPSLEDFKAAFAVEPLNKEFYTKLHQWYEQARNKVTFPNDDKTEDATHTATSLIRLLTRLLFVWFIKEKKLVNPDLFDEAQLQSIIHWQKDSSYYKAILQNLFFATLNREIKDRSFRTTTDGKANSGNYLTTNLYRYRDHFQESNKEKKEKIIDLFADTPFLNGGLFECLDRQANEDEQQKYEKDKTIRNERYAMRMDGFSDRADNPLSLPNALFFSDDESNPGLIDLLHQYQFTVEESTPLDIEVALDPELLGKVFENLLAAYNPETGQTARKATGSYYTPREIVGYMVDESLKAYLAGAVPAQDSDAEFWRERLDDLFDLAAQTGELAEKNGKALLYDEEIPELIQAIDRIKILDPAVGSGAFPMGVLQRLVGLLAVLDPDNQQWKAQQIKRLPDLQSIQADLQTSEKINDRQARQKAQEELQQRKQEITRAFETEADYARKLYLIENAICGVDIQPIACQIAKLRFFISLAIEQQPTADKKDNYGIKALPNLETRFVAANSLIGLEKPRQMAIRNPAIQKNEQELNQVRRRHFNAKTLKTKRQCREQDKTLREEIAALLVNDGWGDSNAQKIAHWDPYNQNAVADWFDPEWMFGISDGFDVVLGNPPYSQVRKGIYSAEQFPYSESKDKGKQNLYKLFVEQSFNLCKNNGVATMIVQSSLMCDLSSAATRQLLLEQTQLHHIIEFPKRAKEREAQVFNTVTQGTCIYQFVKAEPDGSPFNISVGNDALTIANLRFAPIAAQTITTLYPGLRCFPHIRPGSVSILEKIASGRNIKPLKHYAAGIAQGDLNLTTHRHQFSAGPSPVRLLRGRHIARFVVRWDDTTEYCKTGFMMDKVQRNRQTVFLISQEVTGTVDPRRLHFALTAPSTDSFLWGHTVNKTLLKNQTHSKAFLALLNSCFMDWFFRMTSSNNHVQGYELEQLPIPQIPETDRKQLDCLATSILAAKAADQSADTTALEAKIDALVYRLYGLTGEEIGVMEGR